MIDAETRALISSNTKLKVSVSPYTYVRTTVMASRLLGEDEYRKLLKLKLPEIVQFLEESIFKREIDELASTESGVQLIEHAVQRNFRRTVEKLRRICDERMRFLIDVYLWRNDIQNMKTLIRAKRSSQSPEKIKNLFLPGTITKDELLDLYGKSSVEEILGVVELPFLDDALEIYTKEGLAGLETALTHSYYKLTHRIAQRIKDTDDRFRQFLILEVDLMNIMTLLKLKRLKSEGKDILPYIIDAAVDEERASKSIRAKMRTALYEKLSQAASVDEILIILENTRYHSIIKEGIAKYRKTGSLLEMEREVQAHLLRKAATMSHQKPLQPDTVLSFLFAKVIESRNIMMIIKGKELEIAEEFLEAEIVYR